MRAVFAVTAVASMGLAACEKNVAVDASGTGGAAGDGSVSVDPSTVPDDVLAISGMVMDKDNGNPIDQALVTTEPPIGQILTNSQGQYVFVGSQYPELSTQLFRVSANKDGYLVNFAQVLVKGGHNRNVDILLTKGGSQYYLEVDTSKLDFGDADFVGKNTAAKQVKARIDTQTSDTAAYSTNVDLGARDWLSVQPANGSLSSSWSYLTIAVQRDNLPSTISSGVVSILEGSDSKDITVTVTLTSLDGG